MPTVQPSDNGTPTEQYSVMLTNQPDKPANSDTTTSTQSSLVLHSLIPKSQVHWHLKLWPYKIKSEEDSAKSSHLKPTKSITSSTEVLLQSVPMVL